MHRESRFWFWWIVLAEPPWAPSIPQPLPWGHGSHSLTPHPTPQNLTFHLGTGLSPQMFAGPMAMFEKRDIKGSGPGSAALPKAAALLCVPLRSPGGRASSEAKGRATRESQASWALLHLTCILLGHRGSCTPPPRCSLWPPWDGEESHTQLTSAWPTGQCWHLLTGLWKAPGPPHPHPCKPATFPSLGQWGFDSGGGVCLGRAWGCRRDKSPATAVQEGSESHCETLLDRAGAGPSRGPEDRGRGTGGPRVQE